MAAVYGPLGLVRFNRAREGGQALVWSQKRTPPDLRGFEAKRQRSAVRKRVKK